VKTSRILGIAAALLAVSSLSQVAEAQSCPQVAVNKVHLCITPPTQMTDNSLIPAGTAITYGIFRQSGTNWVSEATTTSTDWISGVLQPGTYTYRVTATIAGFPASDASDAASKGTTSPQPKPPTIVIAELTITIPLDSLDGFKRTVAMTFRADGSPGVPGGFVKVGTPVTGPVEQQWRGQGWCPFLEKHPRTGASNVERWGVSASTRLLAPCA
jgi:hypothetical protein